MFGDVCNFVVFLSYVCRLSLVVLAVVQAKRENNVKMINDLRGAVDSVDPNRDTFAYSDK